MWRVALGATSGGSLGTEGSPCPQALKKKKYYKTYRENRQLWLQEIHRQYDDNVLDTIWDGMCLFMLGYNSKP